MQDKAANNEEALKKQLEMLQIKHLQDMVKMLESFKERFGQDTIEIVDRLTAERSRKEGEELAKSLGSNTIDDIIHTLWESALPLGLEYSSEKTEKGMQMRCTRCYIHEMAKELGLTEWAFHLFCVGDPFFVEGFNPRIGFTRTKSLMEGHDSCNHLFYMKEED